MRVFSFVLLVLTGLSEGASVYTQCGNYSFALHSSTTRVGELGTNLDGADLKTCTLETSGFETCTHDYRQVNTTEYRLACLESGGTFFKTDIQESCADVVNGTNVTAYAHIIQTPSCAARSCTEDFDPGMVEDVYLTYFYGEDNGCDIVITNLSIEHSDQVPGPSQLSGDTSAGGNTRGSVTKVSWIVVPAALVLALG
jgi:hypothetical protein